MMMMLLNIQEYYINFLCWKDKFIWCMIRFVIWNWWNRWLGKNWIIVSRGICSRWRICMIFIMDMKGHHCRESMKYCPNIFTGVNVVKRGRVMCVRNVRILSKYSHFNSNKLSAAVIAGNSSTEHASQKENVTAKTKKMNDSKSCLIYIFYNYNIYNNYNQIFILKLAI